MQMVVQLLQAGMLVLLAIRFIAEIAFFYYT
jgi:hypothetical protein